MNACLSERILVELATGDGTAALRAHVAACPDCAGRLQALERDLSLVRVALRDAPGRVAARRQPWLRLAAAATAGAALLLLTLTSIRPTAPVSLAAAGGESTNELAEALSTALFADADLGTADPASDDHALAAALNGGALCDGGYGDDCSAEVLLASYD
ncbi:hypothetical protein KF840_03250 [bacterium]|nr:hypothetical protein [bacterium]